MSVSSTAAQLQSNVTESSFVASPSTSSSGQDVSSLPPSRDQAIANEGDNSSSPPTSPSTSPLIPSADKPPWSNALQTVLDRPPSSLPLYIATVGLMFSGLFGAWTWFGTVQEVSHAYGELVPQGESFKVQPSVQGYVTQLLVKEGEQVKAGQVIATLDDRLAQNEVDRLQQRLGFYQEKLMQTEDRIGRAQQEAQTREDIAQSEVRAQDAAIAESQATISTLNTLLTHLSQETEAHQKRIERLRPLVEDGAIAADGLFSAEQSLRERQQAMIQNKGDLQTSLADLERLKSLRHQGQSTVKQRQLESQQQMQQLRLERTQLQTDIAETKASLQAAQTKLEQTVLYAPADGFILDLNVERQGEVLQPGQTIAELAPLGSPLVLAAALPIQEAGLVEVGMDVQMKFDAFPYQDYGVINGTVITISPDTEKSETGEQQGGFYSVKIDLDRTVVNHDNRQISLAAGQTASADIVTRKRRILDVLLDPVRQLQKGSVNI